MRSWAVAVLDLVFPAFCPVCRTALGAGRRDPLCGRCWSAIEPIGSPQCSACGVPFFTFASPASSCVEAGAAAGGETGPLQGRCQPCRSHAPVFAYARAAGVYAGTLRDALHALKFGGKRALARPLAELVEAQCAAAITADVAALVPVPLARGRLRERGFNQAELIAERIGAALRIPVRRRWLVRMKETLPQSELSATERRGNVRHAFAASTAVAGLHVVVVDDVLTTGATASECARALLGAGARRVGVVTVARVL